MDQRRLSAGWRSTVYESAVLRQQHGRKYNLRLLFDELTQALEYAGERIASRHHLEYAFLSCQEGFGSLLLVRSAINAMPRLNFVVERRNADQHRYSVAILMKILLSNGAKRPVSCTAARVLRVRI